MWCLLPRTPSLHIKFFKEKIVEQLKEALLMDKKLFRALNQFTGHYRYLDIIMIMISKKLRYLFAFILLLMWFRNNFHKRIASFAGISAIITFFLTSVIKSFYFKPRPFLKKRVNLLAPVPSKRILHFQANTRLFPLQ